MPIFKGEYDNNTRYSNLDVVYYNGSSYVAKGDTKGNLPTDDENWQPVAMAGVLSPEQIEEVEQQIIEYVQGQGYVIDSDYTHTDNNFTDAEKTKLDGIDLSTKQDTLVSGQNIMTINGNSILGSGNMEIQTGGGSGTSDYTQLSNKPKINNVELSGNKTTSDLGIIIPTKTSDLTNDSGFINAETEPAFNASPAKNITNGDITNWNGKQDLLQSGINIMTINHNNILGSGNLQLDTGGGGSSAETINVSDTTYTISSLDGNKIYTFTNPLTSLTITAYGDTTLETLMYFTTGTNFTFNVPNDSKYIIEVPVFNSGIEYVISIQNKTIVMGEIV